MPSAILHLTHAELLAQETAIAEPVRNAMQHDIIFARLGSVFFDLPFYTNILKMMFGYWLELPAENCPFAQKMHRYYPELFAWHFLHKSAQSNCLTLSQRLAFLGGFFSHIALDLELHPLVNWCARRDVIIHGGTESHHHRLTEKYQSLFFHREMFGDDILGYPYIFIKKTRIVSHPAFFTLNVEPPVIRWATDLLAGFFHETAPSMRQFSSWIRSFRHFGFMISLPMAARNSRRFGNQLNHDKYYDNGDFKFMDYWNRGFRRSVALINQAYHIFTLGDFSQQNREKFIAEAQIADLAYPPTNLSMPDLPEYRELKLELGLTG